MIGVVAANGASGPIELVRPDGNVATLTQPGQPDRRIALAAPAGPRTASPRSCAGSTPTTSSPRWSPRALPPAGAASSRETGQRHRPAPAGTAGSRPGRSDDGTVSSSSTRRPDLLAQAAAARLVTAARRRPGRARPRARRAHRRRDRDGDPGGARRPARRGTRSTGRPWTSGGATSGSCPPATRTATRPRPAPPCSTTSRCEPRTVHAMPPSDGAYGDDVDAAARGYADELARRRAARGPRRRPGVRRPAARRGPGRARRLAVPRAPGGLRGGADRGRRSTAHPSRRRSGSR